MSLRSSWRNVLKCRFIIYYNINFIIHCVWDIRKYIIISCHLRGRHSAASIRSLSIKYPPFSYHQSSCQTILSLYFYIDQYIFSIWHQLLLSLLYSFLHNFSPLYFMASIRTQHTTYHPVILSGSFSMSVVCSSLRVNHQRCMV